MTETPKAAARRLAQPWIAKGYAPVALHPYTEASGEPIYYRFRLKRPSDGDKIIRPFHLNGAGFKLGEPSFPGGRKPLYRLHEVAAAPDSEVWITEGEQKADELARLGLVATTSGGATSAKDADWQPLAGRSIVIWPDNDTAGIDYAGVVAIQLLELGCRVRCVEVDKLGLGEKQDVVDWLALHQGATRADIEALATREARVDANGRASDQDASARDSAAATLTMKVASDIRPEPVRWIWNGWLARGKLHVLAGAAGTGKTTLALALAATITIGGRWPDGTRCEPGDVVIWSGEDDPADTLVPRLLAMNADLSRVHFVGTVCDQQGRRAFDPATDVDLLAERMRGIGDVALLIVDPIVSAVAGDSHRNAEVRRSLQPLVDLALAHDAALLGITHYSKGTEGRDPLDRVTGSLAFGALARVVLGTARPTEPDASRRLVRAKSNISPDGGGYEYDLEQTEVPEYPGIFASRVLWGTPLEGKARELLAEVEVEPDGSDGSTVAYAKAFLRDLLANGPVPSKLIRADADGAGYSWATIRRAQSALRVTPVKDGMRGGWTWRLPNSASTETTVPPKVLNLEHLRNGPEGDSQKVLKKPEDAQQNELSTFTKFEHLRGAETTAARPGEVF